MLRVSSLQTLASAASYTTVDAWPWEIVDGADYALFGDAATGILRHFFNSGTCENIPGVQQYSGYADFDDGTASDPLLCIVDLADAFSVPLLVVAKILRRHLWHSGLMVQNLKLTLYSSRIQ